MTQREQSVKANTKPGNRYTATNRRNLTTNQPKWDPRALVRLRRLGGLSQAQLAQNAGISKSYLCEVEAGRYSPSPRVLAQLATALNCTIADIADDTDVA